MGSDAASTPAAGEPAVGGALAPGGGPAPQRPGATGGSGGAPSGGGPRVSSVVVFVRDLDVSVAFYEELLQMTLMVRSTSAALLVGADEMQLYLRSVGLGGEQPLGAIGVQYVIWTAAGLDDFYRCDQLLRDRSAHTSLRRTPDGFAVVEGRDPDGLPLLIVYPGPQEAARGEIMPRIYSW